MRGKRRRRILRRCIRGLGLEDQSLLIVTAQGNGTSIAEHPQTKMRNSKTHRDLHTFVRSVADELLPVSAHNGCLSDE